MIATLLAMTLAAVGPGQLQVSTASGVQRIALVNWQGDGPLVPLGALANALSGSWTTDGNWVLLDTPAGQFRFLPQSPFVHDGSHLFALPATTHQRGDSLFVPLAFVSEVLADPARKAWSWSPAKGLLTQRGTPAPPRAAPTTTVASTSAPKTVHHVTIDAGHGGTDPGNPGLYFPRGMREKDVTLAVALKLRKELQRRGVVVAMTRTTDTLINLGQRAPRYCRDECDLFVSVHVNSLDKRPGYTAVRGFETYFLGEARTADAARVARLENEAIRYNTDSEDTDLSGLDFMLKDMQTNEFLRASARAAEYMQSKLVEVESGPNKGVKSAGFAVLTTARRPSILVEIGFATNPSDARLMTSPDGQQRIAEAMASAIMNYLQYNDRIINDSASADHE